MADGLLSLAEDPQRAGLLSLGLRLLSTPGKFGPALGVSGLGAMNDMNQAVAARALAAQQQRRDQLTQLEIQKQQQEQARRAAVEAAISGSFRSPAQQALAGGGGPTPGNADRLQTLQPAIDQKALLAGLMQADPMLAYQMMIPKADELMTVAPGASVINKRDPSKPLFTSPKEQTQPGPVQEYLFAKSQGYAGSFDQWKKENARAGASSVNVPINLGQKGFDNTLKLRGDFRSEPIYKAHNDVASAYAQIKAGLAMGSPAGDLAGATKIMKILDPGSVVRESELGMALAANGLADRLTNYAQMTLSGQKLTPQQRVDFRKLADSLFAESQKMYTAKQSEYTDIAKRNELNVGDVVGPVTPSLNNVDSLVDKYRSK
jgi:hypothetical protein